VLVCAGGGGVGGDSDPSHASHETLALLSLAPEPSQVLQIT
jgi:hypothetical protein